MAEQRDQQVLIIDDDDDEEEEDYFMPDNGLKIVEDDAIKKEDGLDSLSLGVAPKRIRLQRRVVFYKDDDGNGTGTGSTDYEERLEFGRDTNRLDYFPVTPFDVVYGDDDIGDIAIYGGGGDSNRFQQVSLGISFNSDDSDNSSIKGDAGEADDSNISRQVPAEVFADNGSVDKVLIQGLDQESSIGGSEKFIGGVEGAGFWVRQWWENRWLFLALWKTI